MLYYLIYYKRNIRLFQNYLLYQDIKDTPRIKSRAQVQKLFRLLALDPNKKIYD
jgi:hypothetical protein